MPAVGVHRRPVLGVVVLRTDGRTERGRPGSGQLEDGRGRGGNGGRRRRGAPVRSSRAASGWGRPCTCCPARRNLTGVQRGGRPRRGRGGGGQRPRPARRSARPGPPRRTVGHARLVGDATVLVLLLLARLVQRLVLCGWGRGASGSASGPGALPLRRRRRAAGLPRDVLTGELAPVGEDDGLVLLVVVVERVVVRRHRLVPRPPAPCAPGVRQRVRPGWGQCSGRLQREAGQMARGSWSPRVPQVVGWWLQAPGGGATGSPGSAPRTPSPLGAARQRSSQRARPRGGAGRGPHGFSRGESPRASRAPGRRGGGRRGRAPTAPREAGPAETLPAGPEEEGPRAPGGGRGRAGAGAHRGWGCRRRWRARRRGPRAPGTPPAPPPPPPASTASDRPWRPSSLSSAAVTLGETGW